MKKLLLFLLIGFITVAFAEVGKVTGVKGEAVIERGGKRIQVINAMQVEKNDVIKTIGDARVKLTFNDNTVISLGKKAVFNIAEYRQGNESTSKATFNVMQGAFKAITGKIGKVAPKKFIVKTRNATIGIRGTIFLGRVYPNADKEDIACTKGAITVTTGGVSLDVDAGNYVSLDNGKNSGVKPLDSKMETSMEEDASLGDEDKGDDSQKENSDKEKKKSDKDKKEDSDKKEKSNSGKKSSSSDDLSEDSDTKSSSDSSTETTDTTTSSSDTTGGVSTDSVDSATDTASTTTTDATSTATTDTTTSTVNSVSDLSGYQYDGYKSATSTDKFIATGATSFKYDATTSTYTAQNYSLTKKYEGGNTGTTTVSASFTHTPTSSVKKGGYTGHSAITDTLTIPFTSQSAGSDDSVVYKLEMDNMGEFLVGYNSSTTTTGSPAVTVGQSANGITSVDMFYAGSQSDATGLDNSKVYVYDDFKGTQLVMSGATAGTSTLGEIKFDTSTSKKVYLNGKLRSIITQDSVDDAGGAKEFMSLYINDDGSIVGKKYYKHYDTNNAYKATSVGSVTHGALYGTDFQGAGVSFTDKEYSSYGVNDTLENTDYNEHAVFLSSTESVATSKVSSQEMKGYVAYGLADSGSAGTTNYTESGLALTINSATGAVSGSISGTNVKFTVDGTISNQTSYYLNDDVFGAMLKNNTGSVTQSSTSYNYISNSGWLLSRGDKYDAASSTFIADNSDYSSWGYWTGDFKDSSSNVKNVDIRSTWVAGVETNAASIDDLISKAGSSNPVYKGHVLGFVSDGTNIYNIKLDSTNKVNVTFNLSSGGSTATVNNFEFTDSATNFHKLVGTGTTSVNQVQIKNITNSGFDIKNGLTLSGKGTFYGPNAESIGGSFSGIQDTVNSTSYTTTGVIKAAKQ